ncbi:hypothetical protein OG992_08555 [Micromonospora sp. NBC_00362]|nr:hypothetical protein [Micromonospora sp. NBC_00362]MCX5117231.1 hypothetical protein [Micromonospora sp. NBC_00362]
MRPHPVIEPLWTLTSEHGLTTLRRQRPAKAIGGAGFAPPSNLSPDEGV